ncbi:hypothetical protein [Nocardia tengchongensis]
MADPKLCRPITDPQPTNAPSQMTKLALYWGIVAAGYLRNPPDRLRNHNLIG